MKMRLRDLIVCFGRGVLILNTLLKDPGTLRLKFLWPKHAMWWRPGLFLCFLARAHRCSVLGCRASCWLQLTQPFHVRVSITEVSQRSLTHLHLLSIAMVSTAAEHSRRPGDTPQVTFLCNKGLKNVGTHCSLQTLLRNRNSHINTSYLSLMGDVSETWMYVPPSAGLCCSCFPLCLICSCQTLQGIQQWEHTVACLKATIS